MNLQSPVRSAALLAAVLALCGPSQAANALFTDEASFLAASGASVVESFETTPTRGLATAPVVTPELTVSAQVASLAVIAGTKPTDAPGFGTFATDGANYLLVYRVNQPQGSLQIELPQAATAIGFTITDLGEVPGTFTISTSGSVAGALVETLPLYTFTSTTTLPSGSVLFAGLTQDVPFTRLIISTTGLVDDAFGIDKILITPAVPEPGSLLLLGAGGLVLGLRRRWRA